MFDQVPPPSIAQPPDVERRVSTQPAKLPPKLANIDLDTMCLLEQALSSEVAVHSLERRHLVVAVLEGGGQTCGELRRCSPRLRT